jgi:hypothetical protein
LDQNKPALVVIKLCSKQICLSIMRTEKAGMPSPTASDIAISI